MIAKRCRLSRGLRANRWALPYVAFISLVAPSALGEEPTADDDNGGTDGVHESDNVHERARFHFASGLEHVRKEKYQAALQEFLSAQELAPHPAVLFNIARVYEELYQLEKAKEYYSAYLAEAGDDVSPKRHAQAEKALERLQTALSRQKQSPPVVPSSSRGVAVYVSCPYPDFQVIANKEVLATSPLDGVLFVPEDAAELSFARAGYQKGNHRIPTSGEAPTVACQPALEGALPKEESGFLHLSVYPASATVLINGEGMNSREPLLLPRGRHLVEVRAKNHMDQNVTIDVDRRFVDSQVHLVPVAFQELPVKDPGIPKVVGATLAGVGTLLAGTTIGLFAWNDGRHNNWQRERDDIREQPSSSPGLSERQADSNTKLDSIQTIDAVTWTTGIAAGAFLAAGAFTYFFNWDRHGEVALAPARVSLTTHW